MQHRPHARDREVQLEVALVVPGKGPDALARLHPEALQHAPEPVDPLRYLGERR